MTAGIYFVSDLVLAVTAEPFLALLRWLGRRVAFVGRMGAAFTRATDRVGLHDGNVRGPLGLILFSFSISPDLCRQCRRAGGRWPRLLCGLDPGNHQRLVFRGADGNHAVGRQRVRG